MIQTHCRWGILGAASIARKNWQAILHSGNGRLVAVASRDQAKAEAFIRGCQAQVPHHPVPKPLGSYAELLSRDDIDAVYIPLPTGLRKEWAIAAARAGKHVLSEKPSGVNAAELREIIDACAEAKVQYMDGTMFMHGRRLEALRHELDAGGSLGEVRRISTQFSFPGSKEFFNENIRMDAALEPLGCLGDLGWYNVRLILWIMNYAMPSELRSSIIREDKGVPVAFSAEMRFESGATASFHCSFDAWNEQWAVISGTKGQIVIEDFVLPFYGAETAFRIEQSTPCADMCQFHYERHSRRVSVTDYSDTHATSQEARMFRKFGEIVLSGSLEPHWPEISLKTQIVIDACMKSASA